MLLPGFHDSHVHIAAGGLGLATCDLSSDETVDAVTAHVAACARDNPSAAWVTGRGWQLGVFPNEVVTLDSMLLAYTINGARLQLHDDEVGSIAVGKAADLVVLDFKTDKVETKEEIDARMEVYRPQALLYARALHMITELPIRRVVLQFVRPGAQRVFKVDEMFLNEGRALLERGAMKAGTRSASEG